MREKKLIIVFKLMFNYKIEMKTQNVYYLLVVLLALTKQNLAQFGMNCSSWNQVQKRQLECGGHPDLVCNFGICE